MTRFAHFAGIGDGITNGNLGFSQRELNRQPDKMAHPVPKTRRSFRSAAPLAAGRWSVDASQATSVGNLPPGTPPQSGAAPENRGFRAPRRWRYRPLQHSDTRGDLCKERRVTRRRSSMTWRDMAAFADPWSRLVNRCSENRNQELIRMRTANPALNNKVFTIEGTAEHVMTVQGTALKTAVLLFLVVLGGGVTWNQAATDPQLAYSLTLIGMIAGLVLALITILKPVASPYTSPIYALAEGIFLGGISASCEARYPGIVVSAASLTVGTLAVMLFAYTTGVVRASEKFKIGVVAATGAICLVYLVSIVLNLFGSGIPYIHDSGIIGIGFSLFVVVLAALNLVLDFDFIENGAVQGAPKYMEWYGAFGLLVTLVWLYIEILRLLAKLKDND